jgi:hypothetical protein
METLMIDGSRRVELLDVLVLDAGGLGMRCQVGEKVVFVPPLRCLPLTEIKRTGDRGRLVLPHDLALELGLA